MCDLGLDLPGALDASSIRSSVDRLRSFFCLRDGLCGHRSFSMGNAQETDTTRLVHRSSIGDFWALGLLLVFVVLCEFLGAAVSRHDDGLDSGFGGNHCERSCEATGAGVSMEAFVTAALSFAFGYGCGQLDGISVLRL